MKENWEYDVLSFLWEQGGDPLNEYVELDDVLEALVMTEAADLDDDEVQDYLDDHPETLAKLTEQKWLDAGQQRMEI